MFKLNTAVTYKFGDRTKTIVIGGLMGDDQKELIGRSLNNGSNFLPDQIGLDTLATEQDDAVWHQLDVSGIQPSSANVDTPLRVSEFVDSLTNVQWDVTAATERQYNIGQEEHQQRSMRM